MIGTLRKKLIMAAMASLVLVLLVIMGSVNGVSYWKVVSDADSTLSLLAQNDGFFPEIDKNIPPHRTGNAQPIPNIPPEMPFETRYFFATVNTIGTILTVNTGKIAAIDTQTAIEYVQTVWKTGSKQGFLGNYRYLHTDNGTNSLILFLDCRRNLDSFRTLLLSSVLVSFGGASLVFLLLLFFSKRIVKPFSENYEKQKRFITDAGHELKTPLTIIDANTEILMMDFGESEWIDEIRNQTKRLTNLTNDLIFLSRMEEAQATQMETINLSELVKNTIRSFEGVAKTQQKDICARIQPNLFCYADKKSVEKLLTILLDNALKYMIPKGTLACELSLHKNRIQLCVTNPVESMTKEQTFHLFDRFYRTDNSRNSETGGYGLGLSIAQAIVYAHKGKIYASMPTEHTLAITVNLSSSNHHKTP